MNKLDKEWISHCIEKPKKFTILITDDSVCAFKIVQERDENDDPIYDTEDIEFKYRFSEYGKEFTSELLRFLGCNTDIPKSNIDMSVDEE